MSRVSGTMWPHVWCELGNEHWIPYESNLVRDASRSSDDRVIEEVVAFKQDPNNTQDKHNFIDEILSSESELNKEYYRHETDQEMDAKEIDGLIEEQRDRWHNAKTSSLNVMALAAGLVRVMQQDMPAGPKAAHKTQAEFDRRSGNLAAAAADLKLIEDSLNWDSKIYDVIAARMRTFSRKVQDKSLTFDEVSRLKMDFFAANSTAEESARSTADRWRKTHALIDFLLKDYRLFGGGTDVSDDLISFEYSKLLMKINQRLHSRLAINYRTLFTRVSYAMRPAELSRTRFQPWIRDASNSRHELLEQIRSKLDEVEFDFVTMEGVQIDFQEECQVSADFNWDGREPIMETEARPECETMTISKSMMTILPSLVLRALTTMQDLRDQLASLKNKPTKANVEHMIKIVEAFLLDLNKDIDDDFYTGFGYGLDGKLFGDLWRSLADVSTRISSTIQDRQAVRTEWIKDTILYTAELKRMRRVRVKSKDIMDPDEIPTSADGCVCENKWTAWLTFWILPTRREFDGCVKLRKGSLLGASDDVTKWDGVCRAKQKRRSLVTCEQTFARCDPAVTVDRRPKYSITNNNGVFQQNVELPILAFDMFMAFDMQDWRSDICTPNTAPLLIERSWYWNTLSWQPWEVKRSSCVSARIHPPGANVLITRCSHAGSDLSPENTVEWTVIGTFFLVSYYNVWGTTDGDFVASWLDMSWAKNIMASGFPGILDGPIWTQSEDGYGYVTSLQTDQVTNPRAGFFFAMMSEVIGVFHATYPFHVEPANSTSFKSISRTLLAAATMAWGVMKRYIPMPHAWGVGVSTTVMAEYMTKKISALTVSPFRNEHDALLSVLYTHTSQSNIRTQMQLLPQYSRAQLFELIKSARNLDAPLAPMWLDHIGEPINSVDILSNLKTGLYREVIRRWSASKCTTQSKCSFFWRDMFVKCTGPGRSWAPKRWKVPEDTPNATQVYGFAMKSPAAWLRSDSISSNESLLLTEHSDEWLVAVNAPEESARMFPLTYVKAGLLEVTHAIGGDPTLNLTLEEFDNLLYRADTSALQCWTEGVILQGGKQFLDAIQMRECTGTGDASDAGLETAMCYSTEFIKSFLIKYWPKLEVMAGDQLRQSLSRGDLSVAKQGSGLDETTKFSDSSVDSSLQFLHRIGLSFTKVMPIWQLQPFLQLQVSYDVKSVLTAIWARLAPDRSKESKMQKHARRVQECRVCVRSQKAFCDKALVESDMLTTGFTGSDSYCVDKTSENKHACQVFAPPNGGKPWPGAGAVYANEMCPCYDQGGAPSEPTWSTTEAHCRELGLLENNDQRRATMIRSWILGFHGQTLSDKNLLLGNKVVYGGPKGCHEGYKCCGAFYEGREVLRCAKEASLKVGWFRWSPSCSYFEPKDRPKGVAYKKIKENFRCAPTDTSDESQSTFDGHWSYTNKEWDKDFEFHPLVEEV